MLGIGTTKSSKLFFLPSRSWQAQELIRVQGDTCSATHRILSEYNRGFRKDFLKEVLLRPIF